MAGRITVDLGQMRVPISRQNLMSDTMLSFVDKAQVVDDRARSRSRRAAVGRAAGRAVLRVIGSAFNGEGRNQVQNINESFLFAGRVEVTPLGTRSVRGVVRSAATS